jgi:hypothetical protein
LNRPHDLTSTRHNAVGAGVGSGVGPGVGAGVGAGVGPGVGVGVGAGVGPGVGAGEGEGVMLESPLRKRDQKSDSSRVTGSPTFTSFSCFSDLKRNPAEAG